ncbi:FtsX-like permease family protein [Streptomyces scopuliridis]|uniref:ABC transporter permease n=1 Tax=Streptomyces scopuliridis TaxID=452529 RepID=UPI0036D11FDE
MRGTVRDRYAGAGQSVEGGGSGGSGGGGRSIGGVRYVAWKSIRARRAQFVASFLAVLGGAVLVTACGVLLESGLFAGIAPQRYAAAPVVVGAGQSVTVPLPEGPDPVESLPERVMLPAELVATVAAVPGVRTAVGEVSFPATLVTGDGRTLGGPDGGEMLGHGWGTAKLTPFALREGVEPRRPGEIVLDAATAARAGTGVGAEVRIATADGATPYRVVGLATPPEGDGLPRQSALFFTDARARELSGHPESVAAIAVFAEPGVPTGGDSGLLGMVRSLSQDQDTLVERVERALAAKGYGESGNAVRADDADNGNGEREYGDSGNGDRADGQRAVVRAGVERGEVEFLSAAQSRSVLTLVSGSFTGFVLMIVVLVVAGTLSLMVHQRRREIALLRAVAATPRQVHRMLAMEVLLVSGVATPAGIGPGYLAAQALRDGFARIGVIEDGFALSIGPAPAIATLVLCMGAARIAVWVAARRQVRVRPVEALRESAVERPGIGRGRVIGGYVLLGLALLAVAAVVVVPQSLAAVPAALSSMLALIGIALLGPRLMAVLSRLAGASLLRRSRVAGYLAAANSVAGSRRLAAAVTPLVLTIGFATSQFYSQTTLSTATQYQARAATVADFVMAGAGGGVAPDIAAAARHVPGVAATTPLVATEVVAVDREATEEPLSRSTAYGIDAAGLTGTLDLPVASGSLRELHGDTVALSETEALWLGKKVGDRVDLVLGDGTPAKPRVIALYRPNLGFGDVLLPSDVVLPHTTNRLADVVLVATTPDADRDAVATGLTALAKEHPGLAVGDRESLLVAQDTEMEANAWLNRLLLAVVLAYVALSVATTLVTITTGRARELALLRLVGGTRRQVTRMLALETTLLAGIAVLIGTAVAAAPLTILSLRLIDTPLPSGPPWVFAAIVAATILTGVLSIRIPATRVLRARPLEAMRSRE